MTNINKNPERALVENEYDVNNPLYIRFEDRKKEERFSKYYPQLLSRLTAVCQAFDELPSQININQEVCTLMEKVGVDFSELSQLIEDEHSSKLSYESEIKAIVKDFKTDLKHLKHQLKQIPYSNSSIVNNLCKAINGFLEVLHNFFMNGPVIAEGVYIANSSQSHHFTFFHPTQGVNKSLVDLSDVLNSFSLR